MAPAWQVRARRAGAAAEAREKARHALFLQATWYSACWQESLVHVLGLFYRECGRA